MFTVDVSADLAALLVGGLLMTFFRAIFYITHTRYASCVPCQRARVTESSRSYAWPQRCMAASSSMLYISAPDLQVNNN